MSRRKRQFEGFDVVDFLRKSDDDLKSALNSLLRSPAPEGARSSPDATPGLKLIPGKSPQLPSGEPPDLKPTPGINLTADPIIYGDPMIAGGVNLAPPSDLPPQPVPHLSPPAVNTPAEPNLIPGPEVSAPPPLAGEPLHTIPGSTVGPGIKLTPAPIVDPDANLPPAPKKRRFPIREMKLAQDAHTRAEQHVYEYLWQNASHLDDCSRVITIGFGALARAVRLSESNARINLRNLIGKLAVDEHASYNCEQSIGRTYRVFSYGEILKRRREAGLVAYMRRTLAVVFVDPATGEPIEARRARPERGAPGPGTNLASAAGLNLASAAGPKLTDRPGINLDGHHRENIREGLEGKSSSSGEALVAALSRYGIVDDDAIRQLRTSVSSVRPDYTDEELIHFVHAKGQLLQSRQGSISSPIGFLLTSVPKCFTGEAFDLFRKAALQRQAHETAQYEQREAELRQWREEQQRILDDPNSSDEDKRWARQVLYPETH